LNFRDSLKLSAALRLAAKRTSDQPDADGNRVANCDPDIERSTVRAAAAGERLHRQHGGAHDMDVRTMSSQRQLFSEERGAFGALLDEASQWHEVDQEEDKELLTTSYNKPQFKKKVSLEACVFQTLFGRGCSK